MNNDPRLWLFADRDYNIQRSPDGTRLAYFTNRRTRPGIVILNISTWQEWVPRIGDFIPDALYPDDPLPMAYWCPYDNDRILTGTKLRDSSFHLYAVSLSTKQVEDFTPPVFSDPDYRFILSENPWVSGSTHGSDTLLIHGNRDDRSGFYIPQEKKFVMPLGPGWFRSRSFDQRYTYSLIAPPSIGADPDRYANFAINGIPVRSWRPHTHPVWSSWSLNNRYLALQVGVYDTDCSEAEIWIVDAKPVEKQAIVNIHSISIQRDICWSSPHGMYPTWLTDSTLVVSMAKPDEQFYYHQQLLYEIDLKGNVLRQLTY